MMLVSLNELSTLELAVTHILYKPAKKSSLAMLLEPEELPAGRSWFARKAIAWRVGAVGSASEPGLRAWASGAVCACRIYCDTSSSCQLFVQVVPYASERDAASGAPNLPLRMQVPLGTPGEWAVDSSRLPGVVGALACERVFDGPDGPEKQMVVVGNIGQIAFATGFGRTNDSQTWDEVLEIAARQAGKIRRCVGSEAVDQ
jgi:hypothetical protein